MNYSNIDILWILLSAFLVFMMQLGFSFIETGTVRSKNTINVAMKNLIDSIFGVIFFWLIGYGIMFGFDKYGLFGIDKYAIDGSDYYENAIFFFQAMFAATAITIVSGAVAERIKFNGYLVVSIIVTALIYPIFGHWSWNENGWLAELGFVDFAGSTVVHSVGAWVGLAGALVLGPRLGKFKNGKVTYFPPSNHNMIVFGVLILIFAWFGFNGGSLLKFDMEITRILLNTLISASFGGLAGWILSVIYKEKVSIEIFSFGIISGLVGITAGCHAFDTLTSAFVGFSSAIIMHYSDQFLTKKFHIDDPLSVVSIHGVVGAWGTLCVGFFAALSDDMTRASFIGIQLTGIFVAFIFAFTFGLALFYLLYKLNLLRVSKKHEVLGLNVSEHNAKMPWVDTIESITRMMNTGNFSRKIHEEKFTEIGMVAKFFNSLLDILRQKQIDLTNINNRLKTKSELDPLTKILNRRAFTERLGGRNLFLNSFSIIIIDIDNFKIVNDTHGHSVGDSVLVELSEIINKSIRERDVFARWGGEEFILLVHAEKEVNAESIAEKIRIEIETFNFTTVKNITVSLGVCTPRSEKESFDEIFEKADKSLYQAKDLGRNRVCTW